MRQSANIIHFLIVEIPSSSSRLQEGPNIPLNLLFPDTSNLCSSRGLRCRVSK